MSHLTPAEFIDLLEGTLPDTRRAHASECARCRDEAAQAATAFNAVRDADMPEPSPLYWDHFVDRVHHAIREEPRRTPWRSLLDWRGALAAAAAVVLIVIGTTMSWRAGLNGTGSTTKAPVVATASPSGSDAVQTVALESDEDWDVVADAADGMEWDAARDAGFAVKPGAAEHAVLQLTDDQRQELGRMLQAEIAGRERK